MNVNKGFRPGGEGEGGGGRNPGAEDGAQEAFHHREHRVHRGGASELEEKKEGPEEMEWLHFLRPAWFPLELCALCGEGIGGGI